MSPKKEASIPALLALIGATLFLAACGGEGTSATATPPAKNAGGAIAAEFTLSDVHGEKVSLSDTAGQIRLIDFWATWCAPCREEVPMFKDLHQLYGERGFTIIAISDESEKIIKEFVAEHEIAYTNLVDPGEVSTRYEIISLPTAFLVDGQGRIVETLRGPKPRKILESKILELLDSPPET
jgi:peroxiredoxin